MHSGLSTGNINSVMTDSSGGYRWGSVSITGNFRENNEDKFHVDSHARYFLVADGMGGQCAGERASELAIELISKWLDNLIDFDASSDAEVIKAIDQAVAHANTEIMALGELEPTCKNMGTTIVFTVNVKNAFFIGGVGDSRAYQLRDGTLKQLTEDHSLTQALVKAGTITPEDAATHRYRNVLYRYLGTRDGGSGTDPQKITPHIGDRYVLCSDGVSDGVPPEAMQKILLEKLDPQEIAEKLVQAAQSGGSKDNITCVVIDVV